MVAGSTPKSTPQSSGIVMAEIVNLNQYRKKKKHAAKKAAAPRNRIAKGRTKSARTGDTAARERGDAELDGKKLEKREEE